MPIYAGSERSELASDSAKLVQFTSHAKLVQFTHMSATTKAPGRPRVPEKKATQFIFPVSKQEIHCTLQPEQA